MRALRISLVILAVLAVLFVAADRLAVGMAEDEVAQQIKDSNGMTEAGEVDVSIDGFPFLTQFATKEFDKITVNVSDVTARSGARQVTLSSLTADLSDVRLSDGYSSATASHATGTALISYDALTKAADKDVNLGWGGKSDSGRGQVRVDAQVGPLTRACALLKQDCSVRATVGVSGNKIKLRATRIPASKVPGVEEAVRKKTDFDRAIDGLPDGLTLKRAVPTQKGIELTVEGEDVPLNS
ncbi:DUF2993 domain-containing protein [Streptomyces sp. AJS327]|uniref:LmeA family phospholipid-binding protein n=1 Tax=Streptomyces sp. AJS327 TaxID=2545265 RepID=UPI0015DDE042|nr:DUF2993 domain-containing protein [Streptomyces sp. AJS327]MBA0053096.1 DUF2993 domain-containing protein [Streptomyces sp. AJS327]